MELGETFKVRVLVTMGIFNNIRSRINVLANVLSISNIHDVGVEADNETIALTEDTLLVDSA
jgi:hypothetical protein